jgi:hypothetical protein
MPKPPGELTNKDDIFITVKVCKRPVPSSHVVELTGLHLGTVNRRLGELVKEGKLLRQYLYPEGKHRGEFYYRLPGVAPLKLPPKQFNCKTVRIRRAKGLSTKGNR